MNRQTFFAAQNMNAQRTQRTTEEQNQPNKGPLMSAIVLKEDFTENGYHAPCTMLQHKNFLPATSHTFAMDAHGTIFCTRCLIDASKDLLVCKGDLRVAKQRAEYWIKEVAALEAKQKLEEDQKLQQQ